MTTGQAVIRCADRPGDLGWIVQAHGELYADEYGWDSTFEALVARIVGEFGTSHDPAREAAFVAEQDGERVGSVLVVSVPENPSTAKLRLVLVAPRARGQRLGGRLVDHAIAFAREAGYERMTLWTNDVLVAARRIYESRGFELVAEDAHHSFGHDLVGQHWERAL